MHYKVYLLNLTYSTFFRSLMLNVFDCGGKKATLPFSPSVFQNKSPLHAVSWLRVVLDEGHVIRNPNTQMSKAVLHLRAQRRWILSG